MPAAAGVPAGQGPQKKAKKKVKALLEPIKEDGHHGSSKFARALGSVDFVTRERGVLALTRFLQHKTDLSESDMLKLWKGLYFCFWHSDKAPVQADLAERLAGVMSSLSTEVAYLYFTVFITTLQREWLSIDKHRLDKFMMLVRKFLAELLTYLHKHDWQEKLVSQYMSFLQSQVMLPQHVNRAVGLTYHISDIFVPELKRVLATAARDSGQPAAPLPAATLQAILQPFIATLQKAGEEPTIHRVKEGVFDPLVEEVHEGGEGGEGSSEEDEEGEENGGGGGKLPALLGGLTHQELAAQLFELGGGADVRARNRAALYGISNELERAAKKRARRDAQQQKQAGTANGAAAVKPQQQTPHQQRKATGGADVATPGPAEAAATASSKKERKAAGGNMTPVATAAPMEIDEPIQTPSLQEPGTGSKGVAQPSSAKKRKAGHASISQQQEEQSQQPTATANGHVVAKGMASEKPIKSAMKGSKPKQAAANGTAKAAPQETAAAPADKSQPAAASQAVASNTRSKQQQGLSEKENPRVHWPDGHSSADKSATQNGDDSIPAATAAVQTRHAQHAGTPKEKKHVRINLKKNLFFAFKGPVPDAMLRTPPTCRSKGGILKLTAPPTDLPAKKRTDMKKQALAAPHSAPPKVVTMKVPRSSAGQTTPQQQRNQGRNQGATKQRAITPTSVPRARAADFFS